jgi:hypothetical protein
MPRVAEKDEEEVLVVKPKKIKKIKKVAVPAA